MNLEEKVMQVAVGAGRLLSRLGFLAAILVLACCAVAQGAAGVRTVGMLVGAGGLGDQSYNDMTFSGLGKAQKEFGFRLVVSETNGTSGAAREVAMEKLLREEAEVIVASGTGLIELVKAYSLRYPQKIFLINDCRLEGFGNVASTVFAHMEGSYLVGMLAAAMSTTGTVGFVGGVEMPIIKEFLTGYTCGARRVAPRVRVASQFLSVAPDFSGFENPQQGYETAVRMYEDGADVIYSVAGLTGNGVIQAASRQGRFVIGVDADQDHMAKGHVLTSMMKRLDRATYQEMVKILNGNFLPGITHYDLSNGGVSLTPMTYTRELVPEGILRQIRQAEEEIINGTVHCQ